MGSCTDISDSHRNDLISQFKFEKLLNQDQSGRRIILLGTIASDGALLLLERAAFCSDVGYLQNLSNTVTDPKLLGENDVFSWFNVRLTPTANPLRSTSSLPPDVKLTMIYPVTDQLLRKYSPQEYRMVSETREMYARVVRPYMLRMRDASQVKWVHNILEGKTEQESILFREGPVCSDVKNDEEQQGFVMLPDLNWDHKTLASLHLLVLVSRRDIWSIRDLTPAHLPWLRHIRTKITDSVVRLYPSIESNQLKMYFHYFPTYYHLHLHVTHVNVDATGGQAIGKAVLLESVLSLLENMLPSTAVINTSNTTPTPNPNLDDTHDIVTGFADLTLTYTLGEYTELWSLIHDSNSSADEGKDKHLHQLEKTNEEHN